MMKKKITKRAIVVITVLLIGAMALLSGCQAASAANGAGEAASKSTQTEVLEAGASVSAIDASEVFTDRDMEQEPDLTDAVYETLSDGQTLTITEEGVYVISGSASEAQIVVEAEDTAKVQIVLDGVEINNTDSPCIYVKSADKVFVTTTEGSENELTVTGAFTADGDTNTDGVIFSKDDLVINGTGTLTIESSDHGIVSKDDLKITGGTITITSAGDGVQSNDSIAVADGSITLDITAKEGLESTQVLIFGGKIHIQASDDGINGTQKNDTDTPLIQINGGEITISMGQGDTDALDVNGDLIINGGTVDISAQSPFDYDGNGQLNGGTVTVNGQQVSELTNQMMGGMGGMQGGPQGDQNFSKGAPGQSGSTGGEDFMTPPGSGNESTDGNTMQRPGKGGKGQGGQPPRRPEDGQGSGGQPGQSSGQTTQTDDGSWS